MEFSLKGSFTDLRLEHVLMLFRRSSERCLTSKYETMVQSPINTTICYTLLIYFTDKFIRNPIFSLEFLQTSIQRASLRLLKHFQAPSPQASSSFLKLPQAFLSFYKLLQASRSFFKLLQASSSFLKLLQASLSFFKLP